MPLLFGDKLVNLPSQPPDHIQASLLKAFVYTRRLKPLHSLLHTKFSCTYESVLEQSECLQNELSQMWFPSLVEVLGKSKAYLRM